MQLYQAYMWVLSHYKKYGLLVSSFIISGLVIAICHLALPYFIKQFIDEVIGAQNMDVFYGILILLIISVIIHIVMKNINTILSSMVRVKISKDIQLSVLSHLRKLGFSYFESNSTGETLTLINTDIQQAQMIYQRYTPYLLEQIIFLLVSTALIIYMQPLLTLIAGSCYLLYYFIAPTLLHKTKIMLKKQIEAEKKLHKKIYTSVSSLLEIRAFSAENWELNQLVEASQNFSDTRIKSLWFRCSRWRLSWAFINMSIAIIFLMGAHLLKLNKITLGELMAYISFYTMAAVNLRQVVVAWGEQYNTLFHAKKLFDFINLKPAIEEVSHPTYLSLIKGNFLCNNISFSYKDEPTLSHLNFNIQPKERVALVGASGCGKSTILKLLGRCYDPSHGSIYLDGKDLKELSLDQIRDSIGYVFQDVLLFGSSIKENIRFGNPDATDEEVIEAAKAAYAHDFIMSTPNKYDSNVGERGIKLSGGEKQRIAIARLFLKNPPIVLLDEATSSLDNHSQLMVKNAIDELLKGRTIITVAHRLSTIINYDRILVVQKGTIIESGSFDELMAHKGAFYDLYEGGVNDVL